MLHIHEKAINGTYHYRYMNISTKVNPMNQSLLFAAIIFTLAGPLSVSAQTHMQGHTPANIPAVDTSTSAPTQGRPMMHREKRQHGKGHGGMQHGGMKEGSGSHGKGRHADHQEVMQRLDMIEARMAKIEAMLEILMRR